MCGGGPPRRGHHRRVGVDEESNRACSLAGLPAGLLLRACLYHCAWPPYACQVASKKTKPPNGPLGAKERQPHTPAEFQRKRLTLATAACLLVGRLHSPTVSLLACCTRAANHGPPGLTHGIGPPSRALANVLGSLLVLQRSLRLAVIVYRYKSLLVGDTHCCVHVVMNVATIRCRGAPEWRCRAVPEPFPACACCARILRARPEHTAPAVELSGLLA